VSWEQKPLGEVADFCLGKMLDQNKNRGEALPYLANINVRWGEFDFANLREMRFEPGEIDRYGLRFGDIVMCEGGEPGRCAVWKDQIPGMMIQKALHRIRPYPSLDSSFLFYSFLKKRKNDEFSGLFTGSTIKHLPKEKLAKVKVAVPPLAIQRRIVEILSAYDDLIENNQRRIALLEEAARMLYREWFVHFRFPGHEHVKIIDGLPEGWTRRYLGDEVTTQYGHTATASMDVVGPNFLRGMDINKQSFINWSTVPTCPDQGLDFKKYSLEPGDLLVIRMADPGKVAIVEKNVRAVFASYLVRLKINDPSTIPPIYLFMTLADKAYQGFIGSASGGSTRKSASAPLLTNFYFILPPKNLQRLFVDRILPIRELINRLVDQSAVAAQARDLLLPRLMNGEIAV
jgi:type I restriction enzyme S subunit